MFAVIYTLCLAKSLLFLFSFPPLWLCFWALVAFARKLFIPRTLSAGALIVLLVAPFTFLGIELAEPAERWMQSLPKIAAEISKEIEEISSNIDAYATPPADPVEKERSFFSWFGDDEKSPELSPPQDNTNSVTDKIKQSGIDIGLTLFSNAPLTGTGARLYRFFFFIWFLGPTYSMFL